MSVKIDPGAHIVEWQEPRRLTIAIGRHQCTCCGAQTPTPSDRCLIELCDRNVIDERDSTVWPFEHWTPPGWIQTEAGTFCGDCTLALRDFMDERNRAFRGMRDMPASRPAGHASTLANEAVQRAAINRAIDLADDGLIPKHYNCEDKYKRLLQIVVSMRAVLRGESA